MIESRAIFPLAFGMDPLLFECCGEVEFCCCCCCCWICGRLAGVIMTSLLFTGFPLLYLSVLLLSLEGWIAEISSDESKLNSIF